MLSHPRYAIINEETSVEMNVATSEGLTQPPPRASAPQPEHASSSQKSHPSTAEHLPESQSQAEAKPEKGPVPEKVSAGEIVESC